MTNMNQIGEAEKIGCQEENLIEIDHLGLERTSHQNRTEKICHPKKGDKIEAHHVEKIDRIELNHREMFLLEE